MVARREEAMTPDIKVHPLAQIFPMMTDDELQDLAVDIKENGQAHPCVVDKDGVLIDGRNRFAACKIAGVKPTFTTLNGQDPAVFIVSNNLNRRHLKKAQQAMALAMIYPNPEKGGRGKRSGIPEGLSGVSKGQAHNLLSQSRAVLSHSRALADEVLAGRIGLDAALDKVQRERAASSSDEAKMERLRKAAPDVAALVDDERLSLEAGIAELYQRQTRIDAIVETGRSGLRAIGLFGLHCDQIKHAASITDEDLLSDLSLEQIEQIVASANELLRLKGGTNETE